MISTKRTVNDLIIFGVAVLISGWVGPFIYDLLGEQHSRGLLGYLSYGETVRLFLLFLVVVKSGAFRSGGWREMGLIPSLRGKGMTYLLLILAYPTVMVVSIVIGFVVNALSFSTLHIGFYWEVVRNNLTWFFLVSLAGEIIWRGYFTNQLVKLRLKSWHIYLITAGLWWLWRLPAWSQLVIVEGKISDFNISGITLVVATFFMFFGWSVFYTEAFRVTRSIWPGVITYLFMTAFIMREFVKEIASANIVFSGLLPATLLGVIGFVIGRYERSATTIED